MSAQIRAASVADSPPARFTLVALISFRNCERVSLTVGRC